MKATQNKNLIEQIQTHLNFIILATESIAKATKQELINEKGTFEKKFIHKELIQIEHIRNQTQKLTKNTKKIFQH